MELPIYIVDAFTDQPFGGNPAAVCLVSEEMGKKLSDDDMQRIGQEMNLSETSFLALEKGNDFTGARQFNLRWFTPKTEVKLCGHATLATAFVLFHVYKNKNDTLDFMTKSGKLSVTKCLNRENCLSMEFPLNSPVPVDKCKYKQLLEASISDQTWIKDVQLSPDLNYLLIRLDDHISRDQLMSISPNYDLMLDAVPSGLVGIGITVKGSEENQCVNPLGQVYDFVSRFFAPWAGIREDPVTGSWHTCAGAYWSNSLSKTQMYAQQCSSRQGDVWIEVKEKTNRAVVSGQAVEVLKGKFHL